MNKVQAQDAFTLSVLNLLIVVSKSSQVPNLRVENVFNANEVKHLIEIIFKLSIIAFKPKCSRVDWITLSGFLN